MADEHDVTYIACACRHSDRLLALDDLRDARAHRAGPPGTGPAPGEVFSRSQRLNPKGRLPQPPAWESVGWLAGSRRRNGGESTRRLVERNGKIATSMLNFLRPGIARLLNPVGQALARTPVTPNMITVIGTVGVSGAALSMFPIGELFPGALTATFFVFTDMLDGLLARLKGNSGPFGAFLDSTMDRVADASIFGGMVIWFFLGGHNPLLGTVTLFCLACGFLVSYVKARAQGLGLRCDVGLIERPERMLIGLTSVGLSGLG